MRDTIVYNHGKNLYLNITNRCPCQCTFCIRNDGEGINQNESLWLENEPSCEEIKKAIESISIKQFDEVVFCGYGEPLERLDVVIEIAEYIKKKADIPIRINTNGLSDLINNKKTAALLGNNIDEVSISLNAPTKEEYYKLCKPIFGEESFEAMISFALDCKKYIKNVYFTVVDILDAEKINECRELCKKLGVTLRVRGKI